MPITDTTTITPTVMLWLSPDGTDVSQYISTLVVGFEALSLLLSIILGLVVAIKVLPWD